MAKHKRVNKNRKKDRKETRRQAGKKEAGKARIFITIAFVFVILIGFGLARFEPKHPKVLISVPFFNEFEGPAMPDLPDSDSLPAQLPTLAEIKNHPQVQGFGQAIPVLMYHHVGELPAKPDSIRRDLTVSAKDFAAEVDLVQQLGYQTITADQLDNYLQGRGTLPEKPIIFTFDDGYTDVFENAVPILKQHNMIGSFAVITGFAGQPGYAGWDQLQAAVSSGMEIVCHSEHHMDFTNKLYTVEMKTAEVADCKKSLLDQLSIDSRVFVYPYGHFNAAIEQILRQNNFDLAFTTQFGMVRKGQPLLELPRIRVHGVESIETFQHSLGQ